MDTFGVRLKNLRTSRNLKQDQLAHEIGIAPSTVGAYERDTRECNYETLTKLARFFNVSVDYLLCLTDDKRTVELALNENSKDLKEFLSNNIVLFNGTELSIEDKQRILDVLLGLFWSNMNKIE